MPIITIEMPVFSDTEKEWFWGRVDTKLDGDTCWDWTGNLGRNGYGIAYIQSDYWKAHRIAYFLTKGKIPDGLLVLHSCDNRRCCNPSHLSVGTNAENMRQMVERARSSRRPGELNSCAILTNSMAQGIREDYATGKFTQTQLGTKYNVTQALISDVVRGLTYQEAGGPIVTDGAKLTARRGENSPVAKLNDEKVREIRRLHSEGIGNREISRRIGTHHKQVGMILAGKLWAHVV